MKMYVVIIGILIGFCGSSHSLHFEFTRKDPLSICVIECFTVTLDITHSPSENVTNQIVRVASQFKEIAQVTPSEVILNSSLSAYPIDICGLSGGYTTIIATKFDDNKTSPAYLPVIVYRERILKIASDVSGWIYFLSWSISYYPQIYTNYSRKSVVGLNFDFATLNIIGFFLYSLYNCAMYYSRKIQHEYFHFHPKGMNPVMFNDVIFSLHAFFATSVIIYQCCVYERGTQKVSWVAKFIIMLYGVILICSSVLAYKGVLQWLEFIIYCSYIKLTVTMIKYIPQAIMNYTRKSTVGWSIENVLLDFIGGIFSMLQMIINSYNYHDWDSIYGNRTKFGLGLFSVMFDMFFMYQHYVLYRYPYEEQVDEIPAVPEAPESINEIQDSENTSNVSVETCPKVD